MEIGAKMEAKIGGEVAKCMPGGIVEVPISKYIQELAAWAVQEYNKEQGKCLKYEKVLKAKEQVVAGMMYYIELEASDECGKHAKYEAKVWVKQWINWKKLEAFNPILNAPIPVCN